MYKLKAEWSRNVQRLGRSHALHWLVPITVGSIRYVGQTLQVCYIGQVCGWYPSEIMITLAWHDLSAVVMHAYARVRKWVEWLCALMWSSVCLDCRLDRHDMLVSSQYGSSDLRMITNACCECRSTLSFTEKGHLRGSGCMQ